MKRYFQKTLIVASMAVFLVFVSDIGFAYAKAVKLGRISEEGQSVVNKNISSIPANEKKKPECVRDNDCRTGYKCNPANEKCWDACHTMDVKTGQTCLEGIITDCARGSTCRCIAPEVADGSGNCFNPCAPNPCSGATPTCVQNAANYSCICTNTSCATLNTSAAGYSCNGTSCTSCCNAIANGNCNGCTLRCNSGYHFTSSTVCTPDCTAPANGYCDSSGRQQCNSGFVMSGGACVYPPPPPTPPCSVDQLATPFGSDCGKMSDGRLCFSGGAGEGCFFSYCARLVNNGGRWNPGDPTPADPRCLDNDCCR